MTTAARPLTADEIEAGIRAAAELMATADTRDARLTAWETLAWWHRRRSPETVRRLERERGLR